MKLTDKHRSMIASAFVAAFDHCSGIVENNRRSLCCAPDALAACSRIVGERHAEKLREFFLDSLGCAGWTDREYQDVQEQYFLDKIAALEAL